MWRGRVRIFLLLLVLLGVGSARAENRIHLVDDTGELLRNYNTQVKKIKADDVVVFGDKEFTVKKVLFGGGNWMQGSCTMVLDIGNGKVLRIPLSLEKVEAHKNYMKEYATFFSGKDEYPVVKVFEKESKTGQYAVVEKLEIVTTLDDLLWNRKEFGAGERQQMLEEFIPFATKFWRFSKIGEFLYPQIGYVKGRGWVLFDFSTGSEYYRGKDTMHPTGRFAILGDDMFFRKFPPDILQAIDLNVALMRSQKVDGTPENCTAAMATVKVAAPKRFSLFGLFGR